MNKFDLEKRTLEFGKQLIKTVLTIRKSGQNFKLINQLVSSGTSVGANYMEANGAESKNDFKHKISISLKEAKETKYWLELLTITNPEKQEELKMLWQEAHEFSLIFGKIVVSCNQSQN